MCDTLSGTGKGLNDIKELFHILTQRGEDGRPVIVGDRIMERLLESGQQI